MYAFSKAKSDEFILSPLSFLHVTLYHKQPKQASTECACLSAGNDRPALMMAGRSIKNRASAETTTLCTEYRFCLTLRLRLKYIRA